MRAQVRVRVRVRVRAGLRAYATAAAAAAAAAAAPRNLVRRSFTVRGVARSGAEWRGELLFPQGGGAARSVTDLYGLRAVQGRLPAA